MSKLTYSFPYGLREELVGLGAGGGGVRVRLWHPGGEGEEGRMAEKTILRRAYKLLKFEILVEVSLLSPWRSPCRRGTRVIISTPLIPVHVTFAHRVTTCTGSTDKERRLSRNTRNP